MAFVNTLHYSFHLFNQTCGIQNFIHLFWEPTKRVAQARSVYPVNTFVSEMVY